jgi:hypothetical protein
VNQSEDIPGMRFLNSAFDSSTFMRNYLMRSLAAQAAAAAASAAAVAAGSIKCKGTTATPIAANASNQGRYQTETNQSQSPSQNLGHADTITNGNEPSSPSNALLNSAASNSNAITNASNAQPQRLSKTSTSGSSAIQQSANTSSGGMTGKTGDGRALWLKHLMTAASAKRAYCSKTQIYCEAISRALDITNCKVVPFFGAFLHDLRFVIENVPSITVVCNRSIQKPIEVEVL